jgi:FkbM family methyltransferase
MNLEFIKKHFNPKLVLDIGGNTGDFFYSFKRVYPDSYIFIVEGNQECDKFLKQTNTKYLIRLLGKENGVCTFYRTRNNTICTGNSIYREITSNYSDDVVIETLEKIYTLDSIFKEENNFDLIKLDTQGSELDILQGGPKLCKKAKGILMEVSFIPYNKGAPLYKDVVKFMDEYGFMESDTLCKNAWVSKEMEFDQRDILFLNKELFSNKK